MNLATLSSPLYLPLFGAAEVVSQKKIASIIESNSPIGGSQNGKLQPNSHPKELSLITMLTAPKIHKVALNPASLLNGQKH
jgi:hypothetical protein